MLILLLTEMVVNYNIILAKFLGTIVLAFPSPNSGETCLHILPVTYAHDAEALRKKNGDETYDVKSKQLY